MTFRLYPWLLLAGYPVLLWWHLSSLLARPYYQFVVVVPVLVFALLRERDNRATLNDYRLPWLIVAAQAGALMLLALATWTWSPWVGMLSFLIASFCLLWHWTGWSGISSWLSAWLMCWILLPLPFGWDERLTVALRGVTTRMTSNVLDQLGVLHVSYMNVIQVPAKNLFIADACSGVHSLYVLLAASLFWALYRGRPFFHTLLLMLSAFGVVLFENVARLVVIVLGLSWKMDLSMGPKHFVLGLILFVISAGLIISFDRLLLFLLPNFKVPVGSVTAAGNARAPSETGSSGLPIWEQRITTILAMLFLICGLGQWVSMPGSLPDLSASFRTPPELQELGENGVPQDLAGFSRIEYKHIKRVMGDPFGQESQQWLFGKEPLLAQVSIDYPYAGIHDPRKCYSQTGWQILSAELRTGASEKESDSSKEGATSGGSVAIVQMSRPLEGEAILMFSQIEWNGRVIAHLPDHSAVPKIADARRRFGSFFSARTIPTETPLQLPLIQIQLLARSAETMTPEQLERLVKFYLDFRSHVLERFLETRALSTSEFVPATSKLKFTDLAPSAIRK